VYLLGELSFTSLDAIMGCGELLSTRILATRMTSKGIATKWVDSRQIIKTENVKGANVVLTDETYSRIEKLIEDNPSKQLFVAPGFIGSDDKGRMTTLGRGGSDYSASLYAVGSKARALETWKDVPGIMTANPAIVRAAQTIPYISYRAAQELSHFGAKVIYPPTIQPVVAERIPIYVKCTFDPSAPGTIIEQNPPRSKNKLVGISNSDKIALLSLEGSGMVGVPGFSSRLFKTLSDNNISIILITQASSVNTMCVAVAEKDAAKAKAATDECFAYEISLGKLHPLKVEKGYSIVCLVGDDILSLRGTTGRMLNALGRRSIGVRAVAQGSSERNISIILDSKDVEPAIRYIHSEFFEKSQYKEVNLFVTGYGTVGKAFIEILSQNRDIIAGRTGIRLHLAGLSNSRKYIIDTEGIPLDVEKIGELLENGQNAADDAYFETLAHLSLQNSIFVDCTASTDTAYKYKNLFKQGYSVVGCNKIPFSSRFEQYADLKSSAVKEGVSLRYETTVGAALPILETIARCVNSGDEIFKMEAILSGTLNYIYSTYDGTVPFVDIVRKAKDAGYSEPDPRLDLCGKDVLRKMVILSREAGVPMEEKGIDFKAPLPPRFFKGEIEDFYKMLEDNESKFAEEYADAKEKGLKRRYIATLVYDEGAYKVSIGLKEIGPDHPLFTIDGTDNAAIITTEYHTSPIVIKGAGAGAQTTASGVLNDIMLSV